MKKHVNIPIFIPHYGCPNDCVFCNQRKITGKPSFEKEAVLREIDEALSTVETELADTELAFFGGSFTAIPLKEMTELLSISDIYLKAGKISSVRLSTRPDAISKEILGILKEHGVKTIELGIQSFSDRVLLASRRGHTAEASERACRLIKEYGFELIGQMMVGLPSSTVEDEIMTAEKICSLGANGARVYPTVVFPDTELDRMKESGIYRPMDTEEAVLRTSEVLSVFAEQNVPVIRIGLCSNETLSDGRYSENYHPSVGELSLNRMYLKKMRSLLKDTAVKAPVFNVARGKISQAVGQKRINTETLKREFSLTDVKVREDCSLTNFDITLS